MYVARAAALLGLLLLPLAARAAPSTETLNAIVTGGAFVGSPAVLRLGLDATGGTIAIAGSWDQASLAVAGRSAFVVPAYVMDGSVAPGSVLYLADPALGTYSLALAYRFQMRSPRGSSTDLALTLAGVSDRPLFDAAGTLDPGFFADFVGGGTLTGAMSGLGSAIPSRFQQTATAIAFSVPVPEPGSGALLAGAAALALAASPRVRLRLRSGGHGGNRHGGHRLGKDRRG